MVFNVADSPSFAALVDPCIACVLALILHMHISCRMSSPACRMRCSAYAHMCAGAARVCAQAPRAGTQYCMRASAALECDSCQPIWPWGAGRWARGAGHAPANPDQLYPTEACCCCNYLSDCYAGSLTDIGCSRGNNRRGGRGSSGGSCGSGGSSSGWRQAAAATGAVALSMSRSIHVARCRPSVN